MEDLFSKPWMVLVVLIGYALPAVFFYWLIQRRNRARDKVFSLFDAALPDNLDLNLVKRLLASISRRFRLEDWSPTDLLEDYLVHVQEVDTSADRTAAIRTVMHLIEEETTTQPFEDLPRDESRMLRAIHDAAEHGDKDAIRFNVEELSSVIRTRHAAYKRNTSINRWAVPLAVIGITLTILFGLWGDLVRTLGGGEALQDQPGAAAAAPGPPTEPE